MLYPRQVRDFAKATGQLAKTDRIDADILAPSAIGRASVWPQQAAGEEKSQGAHRGLRA
jgi:transposase